MRKRAGVVAAVIIAFALTGCSGTERVEPEAVETTPPASADPEVTQAEASPAPSVVPMPEGISDDEALYLDTARIFDLGLSDEELLQAGWDICDTRRAGEPVAENIRDLEFPATEALCRDVL